MKLGEDGTTDELANLIKQECNRLIAKGLWFLDGYESVPFCFHLHLAIKSNVEGFREPDGGDWGLVVSHPNAGLDIEDSAVGQGKATSMSNETGGNNVQQLMLVSVGEVSQNGKRVR